MAGESQEEKVWILEDFTINQSIILEDLTINQNQSICIMIKLNYYYLYRNVHADIQIWNACDMK